MKKEKPELDAKKATDGQAPAKSAAAKKKKSEQLPGPAIMRVADAQAPVAGAEPKKKKKEKLPVAAATAAPKPAKVKAEKGEKTPAKPKVPKAPKDEKTPAKPKVPKAPKDEKTPAKPKVPKAPKDEKLTKFMVSMKKSVRKSLKKEAAEAGVSMNEFIVLAVVEKLGQVPAED